MKIAQNNHSCLLVAAQQAAIFVQCIVKVQIQGKAKPNFRLFVLYSAVCAWKYDPTADTFHSAFYASVLPCSISNNFKLLHFGIFETTGSDCVLRTHINRAGMAERSIKKINK